MVEEGGGGGGGAYTQGPYRKQESTNVTTTAPHRQEQSYWLLSSYRAGLITVFLGIKLLKSFESPSNHPSDGHNHQKPIEPGQLLTPILYLEDISEVYLSLQDN